MSCIYFLSSCFLGPASQTQLGSKEVAVQAEGASYPHGSYNLDQRMVHLTVKGLMVNISDWRAIAFCHNDSTMQLERECSVDDTSAHGCVCVPINLYLQKHAAVPISGLRQWDGHYSDKYLITHIFSICLVFYSPGCLHENSFVIFRSQWKCHLLKEPSLTVIKNCPSIGFPPLHPASGASRRI